MNEIARGAEAIIFRKGSLVVKGRIPKGYRHPLLDEKLRKGRTKSEAKILEKASKLINSPKIISANKYNISLEYISGKKLSDNLEKLNFQVICKQIGKSLAKIHEAGLIHGDLTTSNLIYSKNKVYFIDFGLGFHSFRVEDKAVDLHLIKQALEARHPKIHEKAFKAIIQGYKSPSSLKVLKQLEKVESRGRYKEQY